jgi:hypothetical protein
MRTTIHLNHPMSIGHIIFSLKIARMLGYSLGAMIQISPNSSVAPRTKVAYFRIPETYSRTSAGSDDTR